MRLQTPIASDAKDRGAMDSPCIQRRIEIGKQVPLSSQVQRLPTVRETDGDARNRGDLIAHCKERPNAHSGPLRLPTVTGQDAHNNGGPSQYERKSVPLNALVKRLPTPNVPNGGRNIDSAEQRGNSFYHGEKKVQADLNAVVKRLPTVVKSDCTGGPSSTQDGGPNLRTVVQGSLNPEWVEWFMGWPIGWTSVDPLPRAALVEWVEGQLGNWWGVEPEGIPRIAIKVPNRTNRIAALGNGQVPRCVAMAEFFLAL